MTTCAGVWLFAVFALASSAVLADAADPEFPGEPAPQAVCADHATPCEAVLETVTAVPLSLQWYPDSFAPDPDIRTEFDLNAGTGNAMLSDSDYDFIPQDSLLIRLLKIRELRLFTLWENEEARLFLGVGRDGLAGLNLSTTRKRKKSDTRSSPNSRPVIFDPYRDSRAASP